MKTVNQIFKTTLTAFLGGSMMFIAYLQPVQAAAFYGVKIFQIVPRAASGDIFIQIKPSDVETRFTGTARLIIDKDDLGANAMLATSLSCLALNKVCTVLVDNVPTFESPQIMQSIGLTAN